MSDIKRLRSALISVYYKDQLEPLIRLLHRNGVVLYSTGGTRSFIEKLGIPVHAVEDLTGYPSILGGRVKTLHPKVFGGILGRRGWKEDSEEMKKYEIPEIDLVVVDLYPFHATVTSRASEDEIIEKIDIGGISLIRAAAKNFNDVLIVSDRRQYPELIELLEKGGCQTTLADRKRFATFAFHASSAYDTEIFHYFNQENSYPVFKESIDGHKLLRYGENPHQIGTFYGDFSSMFDQLHGKEISYNNLLDIDAAVGLISEFKETTFAILKHNNACGLASRPSLIEAWKEALAGDPVSAYGGIMITNVRIDNDAATEIDKIFFEVIIAPGYSDEALVILKQKKNRIILVQKQFTLPARQFRTVLQGVLVQERDLKSEGMDNLQVVTSHEPSLSEKEDLIFANKIVKHTKSNAIVLAKNKQLIGSGVGQTSRVDALKQAIAKAHAFQFDTHDAVLASDAFFPFADSVEIAWNAGIKSVIQPGGSVRDKDSIDFCNAHEISMVFTGIRHFKH
jgi:phosphoribosylaminoimidazolecarboxamide formyltransferase/IMP cyclohydrolase